MGWNGIAFRYRNIAEHDEIFTTSSKNQTTHEDIYVQEKAFFGFFTCCVSLVECLFFSIYCLGELVDKSHFPTDTSKALKRISPAYVQDLFTTNFAFDGITSQSKQFLNNPRWQLLCEYRDVLLHRGYIPRMYYKGGENDGLVTIPTNPKEPKRTWRYQFEINEKTTSEFRNWLAQQLTLFLDGIELFCSSRLIISN